MGIAMAEAGIANQNYNIQENPEGIQDMEVDVNPSRFQKWRRIFNSLSFIKLTRMRQFINNARKK